MRTFTRSIFILTFCAICIVHPSTVAAFGKSEPDDSCFLSSGIKGGEVGRLVYIGSGSKGGEVCMPIESDTSGGSAPAVETKTVAPATKDSVIKSEIQTLLDRIKVLNEAIKNGTTTSKTVTKESASSGKPKGEVKPNAPHCPALKAGLAFGDRDSSKGGSVYTLQQALVERGYLKTEPSGYFGQMTRDAVRSFQKEHGIVSGGDEKSTGYGRVGEMTRALFSQKCAPLATTKSYTLSDVVSVTARKVDPIPKAADDEYTHYVITLKDKSVQEFKKFGFSRVTLEELLRKTGFTGEVKPLLAKVTELPARITPKTFTLDDVATITAKEVDPKAGIADDEYTQYTITLDNGAVVEVDGYAGRGTEAARHKPFKDVGFTGSVEALLEKVTTPAVLGAATSSVEGLLLEIEEKLAALELFFMKE